MNCYPKNRWIIGVTLWLLASSSVSGQARRAVPQSAPENFARERLIAWCIVPFDAKKRGPTERAEMVKQLGLRRVAYDWRPEHVATFEQEILEYQRLGLEYFAFWSSHEEAFRLFEKYDLHPQIWQTAPSPAADDQQERVRLAAAQMLPLVARTRKLGCPLGLYNHGGWGGDPANLVAVCHYLREHHAADHVGIVYNLHHAHNHLDDFADALARMKPYLLCLNLNGMTRDGDKVGRKILPLGEGEFDLKLLTSIRDSGYSGPIGIIGHTDDDVEQRLLDNLDGLDWLLPQLSGRPAGPKPQPRTWSPDQSSPPGSAAVTGKLLDGQAAYREPPITVECRVTLPDRDGYNILVACDTKNSGSHWEIFTMPGSGVLTAYLPGQQPDHVRSSAMICDGQSHHVAMTYEPTRVRLWVDGRQVAEQTIQSTRKPTVPGELAIGRLVEGGLGCRGTIDWVRVSRGADALPPEPQVRIERTDSTLLLWQADATAEKSGQAATPTPATDWLPETYSAERVAQLAAAARQSGAPQRGLHVFSSAKAACLSCHKLSQHGGDVGPELTTIAKTKLPEEIVESVLWPRRHVKPEFIAHMILTEDGLTHRGYLVKRDEQSLVLRDPTKRTDAEITIELAEIAEEREVGTLMPDNLLAAMNATEIQDLLSFLLTLGRDEGISPGELDAVLAHSQAHLHGATTFPYDRQPLRVEDWPSWQAAVNRDRLYDFYAKEANYFRQQPDVPALLPDFPGLDGGTLGHWGNQNEQTWANPRWNDSDLGSLQCGVFRAPGITVPRGVCVRLGDAGELAACFNPETLTYDAVWSGGFLKFSAVRHGFLDGVLIDGTLLERPERTPPTQPFAYLGFHRIGKRVVFRYRIGEQEYLDSPWVEGGQFTRQVAPAQTHPLREQLDHSPPQWPETIQTSIRLGNAAPYAVDTIELPIENPWRALLFCGGHAFLPDGSALVCTMQGDVWHVEGIAHPSRQATWRRFASGLHHAQGIVADDDGIFVLGRDQITRLHDRNGDGEADFYECFSNAYVTSPAGHDFICGLERDAAGNFYTASGNQGALRISADGNQVEVLATGFRNPDGLGVTPDGLVTVPCSEGSWTPASMICAFRVPSTASPAIGETPQTPPFFGYGGPRNGQVPTLPLAYLPRGLDNSSGGQTTVTSERWGPLEGQLLHFSFGTGAHFLVLRDEVAGQLQGAVVPLVGEFRSGAHRGRFSPIDGQLYVTGMQGWGSYTPEDGSFQRVRYTGDEVQLPTAFHVHENGVLLKFSRPLARETAAQAHQHFAQCWNYRYSGAYGSPEFSARHAGVRGHDVMPIAAAHVLADDRTLFLEMPDLQPVNQLHLRVRSSADVDHDLFVTIHRLDQPFTDFPGYQPAAKTVQPHPLIADLLMATKSIPNPYQKKLPQARAITIETGGNLSFATRSIRVRAGEAIELTLDNPDVVPHNWALVKPGTLERVGDLANRLISNPESVVRHYIPNSSDVLVYTDVVLPRDRFTIYFRAPQQPGRYPYLCTFPGHWLVMNGEMIVE